jgi:hypothetical protein
VWVDLITGKTGNYVANYVGETLEGVFPDCLQEKWEAARRSCGQDAETPPKSNLLSPFLSLSINVNPSEQGHSQTVYMTGFFNLEGSVSEMLCYLKNNVTAEMKFITSFEMPIGLSSNVQVYTPRQLSGPTCDTPIPLSWLRSEMNAAVDVLSIISTLPLTQYYVRSCTTVSFWNTVNPAVAGLFKLGFTKTFLGECFHNFGSSYTSNIKCVPRNFTGEIPGLFPTPIPDDGGGIRFVNDGQENWICKGDSVAGGTAVLYGLKHIWSCISPRVCTV